MSDADPIPTGTGAQRRRMTREEAETGGAPTPFTREEWDALWRASDHAARDGAVWAQEQAETRDAVWCAMGPVAQHAPQWSDYTFEWTCRYCLKRVEPTQAQFDAAMRDDLPATPIPSP